MAVGLLTDPGTAPDATAQPQAQAAPQAPTGTSSPTATPVAASVTAPPASPGAQSTVPPPPPPKPMSKLQSGVADILGDLADALAGKTRDVVYRDAQTGERVVDKQPLSRKQQWGQTFPARWLARARVRRRRKAQVRN